jgi:hypothetical protein
VICITSHTHLMPGETAAFVTSPALRPVPRHSNVEAQWSSPIKPAIRQCSQPTLPRLAASRKRGFFGSAFAAWSLPMPPAFIFAVVRCLVV